MMPLPSQTPPIPRATARAQVFDRLRSWIEDGTLGPGELLRDVEIANTFGVSRTPVREALQLLEQLGAVEAIPGKETRVTTVSPEDAALIYPPLAALNGVAAELAAGNMTETDLERMADVNERLLEAALSKDIVGAREADREFHSIMVRRTQNPFLEGAIDSLQIHSKQLDALYFMESGPAQRSYGEHKQIIEYLRAGDATRAAGATRRNFEGTINSLLERSRIVDREDSDT